MDTEGNPGIEKLHIEQRVRRFFDPKNDAAFKKVFASPENKDLLISLLNGLLRRQGEETIKDIELLNIEMTPHVDGAKKSLFDIRCIDQRNFQYIVEIQKKLLSSFIHRVQHYAASVYSRQAVEGENYLILRPVVLLSILNHKLFPDPVPYISYHETRETTSRTCFLKDLSYAFVELPKFTKTDKEIITLEDYWLSYFKSATQRTEIPENAPEAIQKAYHVLEAFQWTNLEIEAYDQVVRRDLDEKDALETQLRIGEEIGIKKGEERGEKNKAYEVARMMLQDGDSLDKIKRLTSLSEEDLKNLV